jgi:radical SAM protein with 4Fe4S-binding SPASM domain
LIDVTLEITRKCSLNCLFCSSNGGIPHPRELNLSEWVHVIDECISLGAKSFLISGGEPFSSPFLKEICQHISSHGANLTIYTCGNVFEKGKLSPLKKADVEFISSLPSTKLIFNLQGASSEIHDLITCVKGSFENTLASISCAVDYGIHTEIHFVPVSLNYKNLPDVVSLSKDLDLKRVSVLRFVPQGRGKKNESSLRLGSEDLIHLKEILSSLVEPSDFVRIGNPFSPLGLVKKYNCTAGLDRMTIRFDGRVVPCEAMKFLAECYVDNDVRAYSLKKIWKESEIFVHSRTFQSLILMSECNECSLFPKCKGGCPAQRLISGVKIQNSIEPYCLRKVIEACLTMYP